MQSATYPQYTLFFLNATPTTQIYTLSLHDALPIYTARDIEDRQRWWQIGIVVMLLALSAEALIGRRRDRKSTRLNSSHSQISYAVFCLKKKKKKRECYHSDTDLKPKSERPRVCQTY